MGAQDWGSRPPKVHSPTPASTVSINPRIATIFTWSPDEAETINATDGGQPDERLTIIIDTKNGTTRTLTFGTNFRSTATLATGATSARRFVLTFVSDGLVWSEQSRTAAQA